MSHGCNYGVKALTTPAPWTTWVMPGAGAETGRGSSVKVAPATSAIQPTRCLAAERACVDNTALFDTSMALIILML